MSVSYTAKLLCRCQYCANEWERVMDELDPEGWPSRLGSGMTLCPSCGCKRCPKASYHGHECTRSNDSGQPGSVYGDFELDTSWMGNADE